MRARVDLPEALLRLARAQAGAVTREQAVGLGLPAGAAQRLVTQGHWTRLGDGVYALSPMEPAWLTLAWAGVLLGGDHACLGGAAAAHLDGLAPARFPIEVLIPHGTRVPRSSGPWVRCGPTVCPGCPQPFA